jgi:lipid A ethanolaminephosphotransferase
MPKCKALFLKLNRLSPEAVISLLALYFGVVLNFPFNEKIYQLAGEGHLLFSLTPTLLLTACFIIIFSVIYSLVPTRFIFKAFMIFLLISSAGAMYASLQYKVVFDYSMIENIFETNSSEATTYLNIQSILAISLLGAIRYLVI